MMAAAARITLAEVKELVDPGILDPAHIHTAGVDVQRVMQGPV